MDAQFVPDKISRGHMNLIYDGRPMRHLPDLFDDTDSISYNKNVYGVKCSACKIIFHGGCRTIRKDILHLN